MKAIISKAGYLSIERPEKIKSQFCPIASGEMAYVCGDWCPAFREPYNEPGSGHGEGAKTYTGRVGLRLCQQVGTLYFDEIEDQRGKP